MFFKLAVLQVCSYFCFGFGSSFVGYADFGVLSSGVLVRQVTGFKILACSLCLVRPGLSVGLASFC